MMRKTGDLHLSTYRKIKLLLLLILGGAIVFLLINSIFPSHKTNTIVAPAPLAARQGNVGNDESAKTPSAVSKPAQTNSAVETQPHTTYLPGMLRAVKRRAGDLSNLIHTDSQWWLLANSEKEAHWMDQMGYPTLAEERFLEAASDAELSKLASNGDMNAKAHLAARATKKAFISGKRSDGEKAAFEQDMAFAHLAGPYQAIVVAKAFGEMMWAYRELPEIEKTEDRRAILRLYNLREQNANVVASAYGEDSVRMLRNTLNYNDVEKELGGAGTLQGDLSGASRILAFSSRWRETIGLPPLTIVPKPITSPMPLDKRIIVERY
jgi:hypothetical protein